MPACFAVSLGKLSVVLPNFNLARQQTLNDGIGYQFVITYEGSIERLRLHKFARQVSDASWFIRLSVTKSRK